MYFRNGPEGARSAELMVMDLMHCECDGVSEIPGLSRRIKREETRHYTCTIDGTIRYERNVPNGNKIQNITIDH